MIIATYKHEPPKAQHRVRQRHRTSKCNTHATARKVTVTRVVSLSTKAMEACTSFMFPNVTDLTNFRPYMRRGLASARGPNSFFHRKLFMVHTTPCATALARDLPD